jgi:multidrug resistance efflux pump
MTSTHLNTEKLEAQFKLLQARLDTLAAKAEIAHADVKAEQRKRVEQLGEHYTAARARFDEMNAAGSEKAGIIKDGFESAWKDLHVAFKKAGE